MRVRVRVMHVWVWIVGDRCVQCVRRARLVRSCVFDGNAARASGKTTPGCNCSKLDEDVCNYVSTIIRRQAPDPGLCDLLKECRRDE